MHHHDYTNSRHFRDSLLYVRSDSPRNTPLRKRCVQQDVHREILHFSVQQNERGAHSTVHYLHPRIVETHANS